MDSEGYGSSSADSHTLPDFGGDAVSPTLYIGDGNSPLHMAVLQNNLKGLRHLLRHSAIDVNCRNAYGDTPLILSVWKSQASSFVMSLIEAGCDINIANVSKVTALHFAVGTHHSVKIMCALIEGGADINVQDWSYSTPLHYAIRQDKRVEAEVLLYYGADVNVADVNSETPFTYVMNPYNMRIAEIPFTCYDDFSDVDEQGCTPLRLSVSQPLAMRLIEVGADVNLVDESGDSPLLNLMKFHFAPLPFFTDMFELMLGRVNFQILLKSRYPFLVAFLSAKFTSTHDWVRYLRLILERPAALDLIKHHSRFYCDRQNHSVFLKKLLSELYVRGVNSGDKCSIMSTVLALGVKASVQHIDYVILHNGCNKELDMLLYTVSYEDVHFRRPPICALTTFLLGAEEKTSAGIFTGLLMRQISQCEDIPQEKTFTGRSAFNALGFFALPVDLKIVVGETYSRHISRSSCFFGKLRDLPEFPSLRELSRNGIRKFVRNIYEIKKPSQFHDAVKAFNLPQALENMVLFKAPVYQ